MKLQLRSEKYTGTLVIQRGQLLPLLRHRVCTACGTGWSAEFIWVSAHAWAVWHIAQVGVLRAVKWRRSLQGTRQWLSHPLPTMGRDLCPKRGQVQGRDLSPASWCPPCSVADSWHSLISWGKVLPEVPTKERRWCFSEFRRNPLGFGLEFLHEAFPLELTCSWHLC